MKELIERLRKATGPDRRLDTAIARKVYGIRLMPAPYVDRYETPDGMRSGNRSAMIRCFTGSIDAGMSLLQNSWISLRFERTGNTWGCFLDGIDSNAATRENALVIAALLAIAATDRTPND